MKAAGEESGRAAEAAAQGQTTMMMAMGGIKPPNPHREMVMVRFKGGLADNRIGDILHEMTQYTAGLFLTDKATYCTCTQRWPGEGGVTAPQKESQIHEPGPRTSEGDKLRTQATVAAREASRGQFGVLQGSLTGCLPSNAPPSGWREMGSFPDYSARDLVYIHTYIHTYRVQVVY